MVFPQRSAYEKIDTASESGEAYSDSEDRGPIYQPGTKSRRLRQLLLKCALVLGVIALASLPGLISLRLLTTSHGGSSLPPKIAIPITQCGNSPDEARKLGCRFEVHNFAWVPPQCYDDELGDDWDSHTDWVWSRSANNSADTDEHFMAECRAGNVQDAWLPWYQHMAHCDVIMKKYMRSVMFYWPMDNWTSNWPHYEHCSRMMSRFDMDPMFYNSHIFLKFPTCDYSWSDVRPTTASIKLQPAWHATSDYVKPPYCNADKNVVYEGIHSHQK